VKNFVIKNLLFTLLLILPLSAGINFVQQNNKTVSPSSASVGVAYPAAQKAGNSNIVVVGWNDTSAAVKSVTDSRGNTYARGVGPTVGKALTQSIYYATNIAGGRNTVSVTFNQNAVYPDVRVLEYSGLDSTSPLDVTAAAAGNSRNGNSGPATTTALNELIFGAGMTFGGYSAAGSGFTKRVITNFGDIAEDTTVLAGGSYSATAPLSSSVPWVMQMAAFRGSVQSSSNSAPPPPPPPNPTAITPTSGSTNGGTSVTITGTGFASGAIVTFGGTAATGVSVGSSTSITATTPANNAGAVDVVVTNTDNQTGALSGGYTYTSSSGSSSSGGGGIAFVQSNSVPATLQSSLTTLSATFKVPQTAGNLNIVAIGWGDTTSLVKIVTDSSGNTYSPAGGTTTGSGLRQAIYYARNIAGGSTTVTVTFNQAAAYPDLRILEYSGLDTSNPLDVTAVGTGTGTVAVSGAATTTSANELIFGAGNNGDGFSGAGTGFTLRMIDYYGNLAEDETVSSTGSYNVSAPLKKSTTWVLQLATFRASGQSSSDPPSPPPPVAPPPTLPPAGNTYTTNFLLTENPISEGGNWVNGGPDSVGLAWSDVFVGPNGAHGEEVSGTATSNSSGLPYSDATAVLQNLPWASNQTVTATVFVSGITQTCGQEVELRLNTTIAPNSITGYEIDLSVSDGSTLIVRWNGGVGNFTILAQAPGLIAKNGDLLQASQNGGTITLSVNGVQKLSVSDTTYTGGAPGIGFNYTQYPPCVQSAESLKYGFTSFAASDSP
jgi:IPT/TIG domain